MTLTQRPDAHAATVEAHSPGRRRALAAAGHLLAAVPLIARARSLQYPVFNLGVASGHPRPTSVVLWTRLAASISDGTVPVKWELATDESFRQVVARGEEHARADESFSVHAEPTGLEPGRWYWYRFEALGERSITGRTRTAPADSAHTTLRLAIASCQRYDTGHYAAWRHVAQSAPDLVVFLGDYIYEYATREAAVRQVGPRVESLEDFRTRYAVHRSDPALQAAHAAAPWLVIWDDHEVDNDYAGLTGQQLQPDFAERRANAYQAWWENMPVPKAWQPKHGALRIHDRFDWGRLARIHLVDTRQYRDLQICPRPGRAGSNSVTLAQCPQLADDRRSMLGSAQERWLEQGWDAMKSWNLLAQTTLMARSAFGPPGAERYWTDGWDGYAGARRRLLDSIAAQKVPGPLVLSGDVHTHVVADLKADFTDPWSPTIATELCSTSISSLGPPQSRIDESRAANPHLLHARSDLRGYIAVDLDTRTARAALVTVDDANDPDSASRVNSRFVIESDKPGANRD